MGTEVPVYAEKCTQELSQISFTNTYMDSCTAVALQTAIELQADKIYLGQVLSEKEMDLTNENRTLFLSFTNVTGKILTSLTPSLYKELNVESIYQYL